MSVWITDEVPFGGDVLVTTCGGVQIVDADQVVKGMAWMPVPEPYQPPESDTSLAASIERVYEWNKAEHSNQIFGELCRDLDRILEAARKWDITEKKAVAMCEAFGIDDNGRKCTVWEVSK